MAVYWVLTNISKLLFRAPIPLQRICIPIFKGSVLLNLIFETFLRLQSDYFAEQKGCINKIICECGAVRRWAEESSE